MSRFGCHATNVFAGTAVARGVVGFGEGVTGSAQDGDEDLGLTDLASMPADHRHGLAGVINEQLLAGTMLLALPA